MLAVVKERYIDFSSWQGVLTTPLGPAASTLMGVGIRVLMMTVQQRRKRMNRQINERLKTLIAAYRTLGGSLTGQLTVDPTHVRELRMTVQSEAGAADAQGKQGKAERSRRIRDAVEAALADMILLGTEEHVRLAGKVASDMAAGRPIHTADLVVSLRNFIRSALDLEPIPDDMNSLLLGPSRTQGGSGRNRGAGERTGSKGTGEGGGLGSGATPGTSRSDSEHHG
jgi:hypothetical protein